MAIKMDANEIERKCFRREKNIDERSFSLQNLYLFSKPQDYTDFHEKTIIVLMF